jgi:phage replication-related protein YjqB (UPF0714/DUF867 family)
MTDQCKDFLELQNNYRDNVDYRIRTIIHSGSIMVLAVHAGGIEPGTSELVQAIARNDFSLYLFEGLGKNNQALHITSTDFDEPRYLEMIKKHHTSLSLHGFNETDADPLIYMGGNDLPLIQHLLIALIKNGYQAQVNTGKYAATDPKNVCNRTISGKGVQMEISAKLRRQFFEDYSSRKGRKNTTTQFEQFVRIIRNALLTYKASG